MYHIVTIIYQLKDILLFLFLCYFCDVEPTGHMPRSDLFLTLWDYLVVKKNGIMKSAGKELKEENIWRRPRSWNINAPFLLFVLPALNVQELGIYLE